MHCRQTTNNAITTFEIADYGAYVTCVDCSEKVCKMLALSEPHNYNCVAEGRTTKHRFIFDTFAQLKEWLKDEDPRYYKFGMHKGSHWKEIERRVFLGTYRLLRVDVVKVVDALLKGGQEQPIIRVTWRVCDFRTRDQSITTNFCVTSIEDLLERMEKTEMKENIRGAPAIVMALGGLTPYGYDLTDFCSPDGTRKLKWFANLKALEEALMDPKEMIKYDEGRWKPKQEFLDVNRKKRGSLGDLQEHLNKRNKV